MQIQKVSFNNLLQKNNHLNATKLDYMSIPNFINPNLSFRGDKFDKTNDTEDTEVQLRKIQAEFKKIRTEYARTTLLTRKRVVSNGAA